MKSFRKIAAVVLAAIMLLSFAGCSKTAPQVPSTLNHEWSYRTDSQEYPIGVYVCYLYAAYQEAYSALYDAGSIESTTTSILDITATFDETDEKYLTRDWVKKQADYMMDRLIAIDKMVSDNSIEIDQSLVDEYYEQARTEWYTSQYYAEYDYSTTPTKDILEPFGISLDSYFTATSLMNIKQTAIFDYLYNKGGIEEVPQSEIEAYFEDSYTSYSYFNVALYESSFDEAAGEEKSFALCDAEILDITEDLELYQKMINNGTSYDDILGIANGEMEFLSNSSYTERIDVSSTLGEKVVEALDKLQEGEADIVSVGEGDTAIVYFIYKKPIADETAEYVANENNYNSLLDELRSEDFLDYLDGMIEGVEREINTDAIAKYDLSMFETQADTLVTA